MRPEVYFPLTYEIYFTFIFLSILPKLQLNVISKIILFVKWKWISYYHWYDITNVLLLNLKIWKLNPTRKKTMLKNVEYWIIIELLDRVIFFDISVELEFLIKVLLEFIQFTFASHCCLQSYILNFILKISFINLVTYSLLNGRLIWEKSTHRTDLILR